MQKIFPPKLKKGDTIGILCVSGDIKDFERLQKSKQYFENKGFNVVVSPNAQDRKNYLCGDDNTRAKMLNDFFKDDTIDAIIAARGGYGAIRLLDKIDYISIKQHPKIFCGYSDITALMLMIYKKTGLVTFNAPMAYSDFGEAASEYTEQSFFNTLTQTNDEIKIDAPKIYYKGVTSGLLWGGNLSTIQSLCGQNFIPDEKFIFVTEDINEPVYKIDKMFTQLLNIPQFKNNLAGIVLGDFSGIDNENYFDSFFNDLAQSLKIPVTGGLKFGHCKDKQTFPIGINAMLDTNLCKVFYTKK